MVHELRRACNPLPVFIASVTKPEKKAAAHRMQGQHLFFSLFRKFSFLEYLQTLHKNLPFTPPYNNF
jgi:hypothetical protein